MCFRCVNDVMCKSCVKHTSCYVCSHNFLSSPRQIYKKSVAGILLWTNITFKIYDLMLHYRGSWCRCDPLWLMFKLTKTSWDLQSQNLSQIYIHVLKPKWTMEYLVSTIAKTILLSKEINMFHIFFYIVIFHSPLNINAAFNWNLCWNAVLVMERAILELSYWMLKQMNTSIHR